VATIRQDYRSMTREQLYDLAQERDIEGRSHLSKDELVAAHEREDQGPDAVRLLLRQHAEMRRLFEEFGSLSGRPSQRKDDLVREIITLLVKHAEIEEQVFYPAVRAEVDDQEDEIDESLEEHHAAELLLSELDGMTSDAPRFDAKVTVLIENVLHHLEEEEQELFPRVLEAIDEDRRRALGAAMETVWRIAPTRPHPRTPDTPPGNVIAGLPATVIDLTVGAVRGVGRLVRRG
jgi:hemerythrin superfamily protein